MGIKTDLTCKEANSLFKNYKINSLKATTSGIIDTTYISENYIIKKYERSIDKKIQADKKLLCDLKSIGLNVSIYLAQKQNWYLQEKLQGTTPTHIQLYHISSLARFMARFHTYSYKKHSIDKAIDLNEIEISLKYLKKNFFIYYKKLSALKEYKASNDGIIHADIFKDNTLFQAQKIAVFDFIDGGEGSFVFDIAVALVGFAIKAHNHSKIELFLKTYNQHAPIKQNKKELLHVMKIATYFYTLKRIYRKKSIQKELLSYNTYSRRANETRR